MYAILIAGHSDSSSSASGKRSSRARAISSGRVERRSWNRASLVTALTSCGGELGLFLVVEELLVLGRAVQRRGGRLAAGDHLGDLVEVAGADLALVLDRGEALLGGGELLLLQLDEGAHVLAGVAVGELEHRVVERVEA